MIVLLSEACHCFVIPVNAHQSRRAETKRAGSDQGPCGPPMRVGLDDGIPPLSNAALLLSRVTAASPMSLCVIRV
jgi:hypothetical protein